MKIWTTLMECKVNTKSRGLHREQSRCPQQFYLFLNLETRENSNRNTHHEFKTMFGSKFQNASKSIQLEQQVICKFLKQFTSSRVFGNLF